jgi:putative cell wall-binding protein
VGASQVARIAGSGRYVTSCMVANVMIETELAVWGAHSEAVFLASGENYPDAVSASALGAGTRWPVVLIDPINGLDPYAKATLKRAATVGSVMLGGTRAIPKVIHTQVSQVIGTVPIRLAGADRYATSVLAARFGVEQIRLSWDRVAIATGLNYPDALTGGVLQGRFNSVMLLTHPTSLPASVGSVLAANKATIYEVRYLGGPKAVTSGVRAKIEDALR